MEKPVRCQAYSSSSSSLSFSNPSLLHVTLLLVFFLGFACFFSSGFPLFILALSLLILSVFLITFIKKDVILANNTFQDVGAIHGDQDNMLGMDIGAEQNGGQVNDYKVGSTNLQSESESSDEDFELNWNVGQNPMISSSSSDVVSDGSDTDDEDNLIEIALPNGQSVNLQSECFWQKRGLVMDLLAEVSEMNTEEENLIEIDISVGSIKSCSGFEIGA